MPRVVNVGGNEVSLGIGWFLILVAVIIFALVAFGATPFGMSASELVALGLAFFAAGHLA